MKLVKLECPNCGASFEVDKEQKKFFCKYCRTTTLLDDGVIRIEHTIVDNNKEEKLKLFKGIGITSMVYVGIVMMIVIAIFGIVIFNIVNTGNRIDDLSGEYDNAYSEVEIRSFNGAFELYSGTKSAFFVEILLDKVITNNKTKPEHIITVIFEEVTTIDTDEIKNIKYSLEDGREYEVSLDYDTNGFVNKITLTAI